MFSAIIWDLDGTLFASGPETGIPRLRSVVAKRGLAFHLSMERVAMRHWGARGIPFVQQVLGIGRKLAADIYAEWEAMDEHEPQPLVHGADLVLEHMREKGVVACLLTSRGRASTLSMLSKVGIRQHFEHIATADDVEHHKPDPRALDGTLAWLAPQIPPEHCLYVGDTLHDADAAIGRGIEFLMVATGPYRDSAYRVQCEARKLTVVPTVAHVPFWIEARRREELAAR